MSESDDRLPQSLLEKHAKLQAALEKGHEQYKAGGTADAEKICNSVVFFVDAYYRVSDAQFRLSLLATFIERSCRSGSRFAEAKTQANALYRGHPRKFPPTAAALTRLRSKKVPEFSTDIQACITDIGLVLKDSNLRLSDAAREAYEGWRQVCVEILREAVLHHVDGCNFLWRIHNSSQEECSPRDRGAAAIASTKSGAVKYDKMREATNSLMEWAKSHPFPLVWENTAVWRPDSLPYGWRTHACPVDLSHKAVEQWLDYSIAGMLGLDSWTRTDRDWNEPLPEKSGMTMYQTAGTDVVRDAYSLVESLKESHGDLADLEPPTNDIDPYGAVVHLRKIRKAMQGRSQDAAQYLGNGVVELPGLKERVVVTPAECVRMLEFLVECPGGRAESKALTDAGFTNPSMTAKTLAEWDNGKLAPYVQRPGREKKGLGYSTTIIDARKK